jgi:hypothetical protein
LETDESGIRDSDGQEDNVLWCDRDDGGVGDVIDTNFLLEDVDNYIGH